MPGRKISEMVGRQIGQALAYFANPVERMPGEDILDFATRTQNWMKARDAIFQATQRPEKKPSKAVAKKAKKSTSKKRGGLGRAFERKKATERALGIKKKKK